MSGRHSRVVRGVSFSQHVDMFTNLEAHQPFHLGIFMEVPLHKALLIKPPAIGE